MKFLLLLPILLQTCQAQINNAATLDNNANLTLFSLLLDNTGISPNIALTIFAPTQAAWDAFKNQDAVRWDQYQAPLFFIHLRDLLEWHLVTEGAFKFDEIFDGRRGLLENQHGNITVSQQFQKLDNVPASKIIERDIETSEGIIHVINEVIVPPYLAMNLIAQLLDDRSDKFALSTFANLALHVGLDDEINMIYENGVTVLVPPNPRFNRAQINLELLQTPEMRNYTRDFILCHMIMDNYYEAGVFAFNEANDQSEFLVKSFLGTHMWITTTEDKLRFQSTPVLVADQATYGGIFHIIDYPLTPPFASDFAYFMPLSTSWDTTDCFRFFRQTLLSSEDISKMFDTNITLWCPTTEAFAFFNNEDFNRLMEPEWVRHATEFLLNHMSAPALTRQELVNLSPGYITMLNGATYELRKSGTRPRIKNGDEQGRSDFGDLITVDGYMHILDTAITPTSVSRSIYDQSNENPDFSLLVENIDFVDLMDLVDRDLPLTMLAPDNNAWRRIEFGSIEGPDIIKRHLFRGLLFTDVIANSSQITSVNGQTLAVELRGKFNESLFVGGGFVYEGDILARNGVLHYIDRVIGMPYPTSAPTVSPAPTVTATPTIFVAPTTAPVEIPTGPAPIYLPPVRAPTLSELVTADDKMDEDKDKSGGKKSFTWSTAAATVPILFAMIGAFAW